MNLPFTAVGIGAALVAGLVLAIIGHPEQAEIVVPASAPVSTSAPQTFVLKSVSVELPTSEIAFPGPANAEAINANCLACHSAGMVQTQHNLSKATWAALVDKMIHAYKAPVAEKDVPAIVDYLTETKGLK
jgi:cytochrome c5